MSNPRPFFSSHFTHLNQRTDCSENIVGLKAGGLLSVPEDWTPAFAIICAPNLVETTASGSVPQVLAVDSLRQAFAPLFSRHPRRLIVRSSATVEEIECRGWLESKTCEPSPEDVSRVALEVLTHSSRVLQNSWGDAGAMALVIQEYKIPRLYGHLSNERRVSQRSNRWLCEIETPTIAGAPKLSWINVKARDRQFTPRPLLCSSEATLEKALAEMATWTLSERVRSHFEWVWDGERLWVVQRDLENVERGNMPSSSAVPVLFDLGDPQLEVFVDATRTRKPWKKAGSLRIFSDAGLPSAKLFVLEDEKTLLALSKNRIPTRLRADVRALLQSPIVVRTDFLTSGDKPAFLSPRSETLTSADAALEWLKRNAREIISKGARPDQFCFLLHRYITARAGAFGLSRPENTRVRVDAIWGLPDGLLCFPHDSFEVDTSGKGEILRHVRCKPFYLTSNERGAWTREKCSPPWDWKPALSDSELKSIAIWTKQLSKFLKRPLEVMFFVGVDGNTGYPPILPWIHVLEIPDKPKEAIDLYYAGKPFTVSNEVDLNQLTDAMSRERETSKVYIRLQPSPDLLRSKEFVNQVATTANKLKIPVQLEGSILSHIYYMLTKQNVRVRCADPFLPSRRQRFGKLVRDLIPVTIEARGERVRTITIPKEQLAKFLKVKALEEALELFWETDSAKSFEEMADILEVVLSACRAYGRHFDDLVKLAEKKRSERGGFDKGVVLVETSHVPLIGEETEASLFDPESGSDANTEATPAPKGAGVLTPPRKPRIRGKEAAIPLIPPTPEDPGQEYVILLPDEEHELVMRYTAKELLATVRKKRPPQPPPNQLELRFE